LLVRHDKKLQHANMKSFHMHVAMQFEFPPQYHQQWKQWDWIGLSGVLRPCQHRIEYMGDGFYRSKDPTNSIKVLKVHIVQRQIKHTISRHEHKTHQVP